MADKLYYDPSDGEEPGIEEGDWMDYIQPIRSLFSGGVVKTAVGKATKGAIKKLKEMMPAAPSEINYSAQKIGRGPTSTKTDATTGFSSKPGSHKVRD